MRCPACSNVETKVVDSRSFEEGIAIRRRRECEKCGFRFSTSEEMEILHLWVVKSDLREEPYDREKLTAGMHKAFEKRPITNERFRRIVNSIEQDIQAEAKADKIRSSRIGEIVMKHLRRADKVAYVRFASVYESYENVENFEEALQKLLHRRSSVLKPS
ncbi:MAG: transcriptional repressor NrdR [Candidatus Kerfeldbacteria bacterium]|nr:transcriptional repressor NrdR [Candidatus Kerfeldbacteria bacterium]